MGEIIKLKVGQAPVFADTKDMLNQWWKEQEKKPLRKIAEAEQELKRQVSNINTVSATTQALKLNRKESLSLDENVKRIKELKENIKSKG